jgi:hypothetical protein
VPDFPAPTFALIHLRFDLKKPFSSAFSAKAQARFFFSAILLAERDRAQ